MAFNIVELATAGEKSAPQRCVFGHLVEDHAVYCHNDKWADGPRKCRRTWYTGGKTKDEDCPGFSANPEFKGQLEPVHSAKPLCQKCKGKKVVLGTRGQMDTCSLCMGDGSQPKAIKLSVYGQNTLERGCAHGGNSYGHGFIRIAETDEECDAISGLIELELVVLRSESCTKGSTVYLLENTLKGEAVMRANWKANKEK